MAAEKVVVPDEVSEAVKVLKGDSKEFEERYLVLGYADKSTLCVVASGSGGFNEVAAHLDPSQARYALIRKVFRVEMANTIKFVYIDWTPEAVPPMRRALLSTHKGQVEAFLKPYHVSFQASALSDLDGGDEMIASKLGAAAGTASHVRDQATAERKTTAAPAVRNVVPTSVRDDVKLNFENEEDVKGALAAVRQDNSGINWALVTYKNASTLTLVGKGGGGVEELAAQLTDSQYYYAFFRVVETYDKSQRVMFGFLKLVSDAVSPMQRAKMSTHAGFITSLFQPFHVEFALDNKSEFTAEAVKAKIQDNMGTRSRVRDHKAENKAETSSRAAGPTVPKVSDQKIEFTDDDEFKAAIADVRNDSSNTKWMVVSYASKNTLDVVGTGEGGADELAAKLQDDKVNFALLRVTDQIDNSTTVKFVYVHWQPDSIPPLQKAQLSTLSGVISSLFSPYHLRMFISSRGELTDQIVSQKVGSTSGSRSSVVPAASASS